jgi:hypothetical protein
MLKGVEVRRNSPKTAQIAILFVEIPLVIREITLVIPQLGALVSRPSRLTVSGGMSHLMLFCTNFSFGG